MCFDTPDPPLTGPRPNYPRNPGGGGGSRTEDAPQGVPPEAGCSAQGSITASIGLFGDVKAKLNGAFSLQASLNLLKFNIPIVGPEAGPRPAGMALFPITQSVGIVSAAWDRFSPFSETAKWVAFVLMLLGHVNAYVVGGAWEWAFLAGRVCFPLFAVSLAVGLARAPGSDACERCVWRLLAFGAVAQVPCVLLRDAFCLNVFFTYAFGVSVFVGLDRSTSCTHALLSLLVGVLGGAAVEFAWPGVAVVASLLWCARYRTWLSAVVSVLSLASLGWINGVPHAMLVMGVVPLLVWCRVQVPRVRRWFWWAYPAHLSAFAVMRWA